MNDIELSSKDLQIGTDKVLRIGTGSKDIHCNNCKKCIDFQDFILFALFECFEWKPLNFISKVYSSIYPRFDSLRAF